VWRAVLRHVWVEEIVHKESVSAMTNGQGTHVRPGCAPKIASQMEIVLVECVFVMEVLQV